MCDINDSDVCFAALEPKLPDLVLRYPGGGVFAYKDAGGRVRAKVDPSYVAVEALFNQLGEEDRARGVLLRLTNEDVLCAF